MPNVVVFVEMRHGGPTAPSLFALGEARRLADEVGATIYALLAIGDLDTAALDTLSARLGGAGADKILLCQHASLGGPPLDATHGHALAAAVERVPPALVLFPAGACGAELGPRLATRLGAAYAPAADLEVAAPEGPSRVRVHRRRAAGDGDRFLDPVELERPVVATLRADRPGPPCGSDDVEIELVAFTAPEGPAVQELAAEDDGTGDLDLARGLVLIGPGVGADAAQALVAAAAPDLRVVVAAAAAPLEAACPSFVLAIGGPAAAPGSPATRRGAVAGPDPSVAAGADLVWHGPATAAEELARALAARATAGGQA